MNHVELVEWIHTTVNTFTERLTWSAVLLLGLVLTVAGMYVIGPRLKHRIADEVVEVIQSVVVTVAGVVVAVVLVVTWELGWEVKRALGTVAPGPVTGVKIMVVLLVLAGAYTVTRFTKRFVKEGAERNAITAHQREVFHHVVQIVVYVPAVLFAFALWEVEPASLLLGAGVLGIVIGLAARQTLGAALAGFVVLFSRPFEVGDWVVIDDQEGIVQDITIVNTRIRTFDHEQVMIPNDTVTGTEVVNRSRTGRLRIQVDVGVDYDADVERAAEVALAAIDDVDELLSYPEPDVVLDRFGDSAVVLTLRFWISNPSIAKKWDARNAVMRAVKTAFDEEGIKIPFPQRELAGREEAGGLRLQGGTETTSERIQRADAPNGRQDAQTDAGDTPASVDEDDD